MRVVMPTTTIATSSSNHLLNNEITALVRRICRKIYLATIKHHHIYICMYNNNIVLLTAHKITHK